MLVWRRDRLLLIERLRPPFGFAPPAGHVDDHGSFEMAAKNELKEETGLTLKKFELLVEGRKNNPCRRINGSWHQWKIYRVAASGQLRRSRDEAKQIGWFSRDEMSAMLARTQEYLRHQIDEAEWKRSPGLEPVWYEWFTELGILKTPDNSSA